MARSVTASWAGAQGADCLPIETFADSQIGQFPAGWKARKDAGKAAYTVQEEGGLRFLRALVTGLGIQAGREYEWDLTKYPVLAWSWRPRLFPQGADERESAKNDSPLAVYMTVPHSRIKGPKAVKYIWSERVPVGTRLSSNMGLTQVLVLRSGPPSAPEAVGRGARQRAGGLHAAVRRAARGEARGDRRAHRRGRHALARRGRLR